jgi:membrane protease YdiL (CAAX protease family)
MSGVAAAALLVVYNTVTNLRPEADHWYIARNLASSALLVYVGRRRGLTWQQLGLAPDDVRAGWRWGRTGAGVMAGTVALWAAVARHRESGQLLLGDRRAALAPRELGWQTLVRIPFGTAAFEELAFRGVLYALLHEAGGKRVALAGSSAAFGLWHVGPALATLRPNAARGERRLLGRRGGEVSTHGSREARFPIVGAVAMTAAGGGALAGLRSVSGHVLAGWMAHWATNAVGLVIAARWQSNRSAEQPGTVRLGGPRAGADARR